MSVEVLLVDTNTHHANDYEAYRPNGVGSYLISCFDTPFSCFTKNGWQDGEAGDCIIMSPKFKEHHRPTKSMSQGFINDWIHVSGSSIPALLEKYNLSCNEIIPTHKRGLITAELLSIEKELYHKNSYYLERIELLTETILLKISRAAVASSRAECFSPRESYYLSKFLELRQSMYDQYTFPWTIKELAQCVNLSESRFTVLYRSFFGISPYEDLMNCKIDAAKKLLLSTSDKISSISECTGFTNTYYFSRIFHKYVGCSPKDYRRGHSTDTVSNS